MRRLDATYRSTPLRILREQLEFLRHFDATDGERRFAVLIHAEVQALRAAVQRRELL